MATIEATQTAGRSRSMMTIVTRTEVKEGAERKWDAVMRERMAAAKGQPDGWAASSFDPPTSRTSA
jgi:hypothetical protein